MALVIPYPGSKRTCVDRLIPMLGVGRLLVSPFCGMAAVEVAALEARRFERAELSDASPHAVAVLHAIQGDPVDLYAEQVRQRTRIGGDRERLVEVQAEIAEGFRNGAPARDLAPRILGASCWTYSRLWRVNGSGGMNGSVDRRGRPAVALATLQRYAAALKRADVRCQPWPEALRDVSRAVVYCDPPYLGKGGFVAYTAAGWKEPDAQALASRLAELYDCRIVLSEQDPGGAPLYLSALSAARRCSRHAFSRVRNVRGDQMSQPREEVTLVAPVSVVIS